MHELGDCVDRVLARASREFDCRMTCGFGEEALRLSGEFSGALETADNKYGVWAPGLLRTPESWSVT